jgi:hypothetical protein
MAGIGTGLGYGIDMFHKVGEVFKVSPQVKDVVDIPLNNDAFCNSTGHAVVLLLIMLFCNFVILKVGKGAVDFNHSTLALGY